MWDGSLANGINKDQNGAVVAANTQVWTGTGQSSGLPYNYPTGPFYQTFNNDWSRFGLVGATNSAWITADQSSPGSKRMYALSGPLTNTVAPPTITVTLGMDQTTIAESAGAAIVTATLSQVAALDVTVNLAFTGTATLGTDYTAAPGTSIVITAGQLSGTATLTAVADGIYEGGNENIVVDIDSVLNALEDGTQQVTVTITEGDLQPAGLPMPLGINPATGILWQPGDSYQLVFVTSTITAATNPSITYYNTFVNTAATGSSVSGVPNIVWKAIGSALSDSATPAKVNAPVVAPVYLLDGVTKVANGYSDMWDGSIANPISLDESGVAVDAGVRAWTGSDAAGNSYRPLGKLDNYVQFGSTASTTGGWISSGEQQGGSNRMYALSVPLTHAGGVPAVAPLAPTITGITPGVGTLSVAFTAGYDGGAAITNYKYSTDDGATWTAVSPAATTSPILISGLTNGTTYQVRILAVNSVGDGAPSTAMSGTPDASGTSYATWATANGASTDPLEDSNNNGVPNGVEFFMGGTAASPAALPPLVNTAGTWSWTIPYDPAAQATYKFQVSGALTGWTDVLPGDPSIAVLTGPDQLRLTLPTGMRFCRLVVTPN
jgi:hypothetical protein